MLGKLHQTWIGRVVLTLACTFPAVAALAQPLPTAPVQAGKGRALASFDAVVEPVRQTVLAAQVQGAVIGLEVKAGDAVREGQVLVRIDARTAAQQDATSQAQVQAARSALEVATREYQRQQQLFNSQYISRAALERAEAEYRATTAQLNAQIAQANASRIQAGFYVIKAPYSGIVSEVPVMLGDMALPGRPLLTLYDPAELRVTAHVPQSALPGLALDRPARIEFPGFPDEQRWAESSRIQVLPTADAGSHTAQLRIQLPAARPGVMPGAFARAWLAPRAVAAEQPQRLYIPAASVLRRAEMVAVYVQPSSGKPALRQVRLGRGDGDLVEVLSGLSEGEHVVLDPRAAARVK